MASGGDGIFIDHAIKKLSRIFESKSTTTDPVNTATSGDLTLTDKEIEDLAQVIVSKHMATIAIKYLGLPYETVENLKLIRQGDFVAFNRDLLVLWRYKNPGDNQVQVCIFCNLRF